MCCGCGRLLFQLQTEGLQKLRQLGDQVCALVCLGSVDAEMVQNGLIIFHVEPILRMVIALTGTLHSDEIKFLLLEKRMKLNGRNRGDW